MEGKEEEQKQLFPFLSLNDLIIKRNEKLSIFPHDTL